MADTVITDAIPGIQDEGLPNISDGNEDWGSAGLRMVLAQAVDSGSYVRSDSELTFANHDGTNDQVDVTAGIAYLDLTGETINYQESFGGTSPPAYTGTLPVEPAIPVIVPNTVADLAVQDSTLSSVWLAYATDGTVSGVAAGDVYLRSDDTGSVTAPPHPNVELGQANPDNAGADDLRNRFASPTFDSLSADEADITNETFVRAYLDTDQTGISSGTWTNIITSPTEQEDNRGELNASGEFTPDETGFYTFKGAVNLSQGSSGDQYRTRLYDVTNGIQMDQNKFDNMGAGPILPFILTQKLTGGDTYRVDARNDLSSYDIASGEFSTNVKIIREIVHP